MENESCPEHAKGKIVEDGRLRPNVFITPLSALASGSTLHPVSLSGDARGCCPGSLL